MENRDGLPLGAVSSSTPPRILPHGPSKSTTTPCWTAARSSFVRTRRTGTSGAVGSRRPSAPCQAPRCGGGFGGGFGGGKGMGRGGGGGGYFDRGMGRPQFDRPRGGGGVSNKYDNKVIATENPQGERVQLGRRLYVGNLAFETTWQDLKDHFKPTGDVVYADVFYDFNGYSRGCGIVEFSNPRDAERAMAALHDSELMGRKIFVREDREDRALGGKGGGKGGKGGKGFGGGFGRGGKGGYY
eukprot:Sspe_Gene.25906::Locus_10530_Transcript_2_2_Confidence_0.500_Length_1192::g.25906::m.25906